MNNKETKAIEKVHAARHVLAPLPMPCGANPSKLSTNEVGCGVTITDDRDLYRCGECHTPLHWQCLLNHFNDHHETAYQSQQQASDAEKLRIYRDLLDDAVMLSRCSCDSGGCAVCLWLDRVGAAHADAGQGKEGEDVRS